MKTISKLAFALALTTGVSGLALQSPALAQKKDKADAKKPGLKLSPEVIKAAQPAQAALAAKDFATAEPNIVAMEAAAKTPDDQYIAAALRLELEQRKLIAQQEANPNTPVQPEHARRAARQADRAAQHASGGQGSLRLSSRDPGL